MTSSHTSRSSTARTFCLPHFPCFPLWASSLTLILLTRYWKRAGVSDKIQTLIAPATDSIRQLKSEGHPAFDLVFIDADKPSYKEYVSLLLELDLLTSEGIILAVSISVLSPAELNRRLSSLTHGVPFIIGQHAVQGEWKGLRAACELALTNASLLQALPWADWNRPDEDARNAGSNNKSLQEATRGIVE